MNSHLERQPKADQRSLLQLQHRHKMELNLLHLALGSCLVECVWHFAVRMPAADLH
jgi:hypothetical protein